MMGLHIKFSFIGVRAFLSLLLLVSANSIAWGNHVDHLPVVRYSNDGGRLTQCPSRGYFDVFYFNSEAPSNARIVAHRGFEVSAVDDGSFDRGTIRHWVNESRSDMVQWEEFGWYVRIPQATFQQNTSLKTIGIDLSIEVVVDEDKDLQKASNLQSSYFRGFIPDMTSCENQNPAGQKSCDVVLEPVTGRASLKSPESRREELGNQGSPRTGERGLLLRVNEDFPTTSNAESGLFGEALGI